MRKNVRKKWMAVVLLVIFVVALSGCGTKTEETEQVSESSEAIETDNMDETENAGEATEGNTEDENIVLYAEKGHQDYVPLDEIEYELHEGIITATEDVPLYDGKGYSIGYIKNGSTVSVTEYGTNAWARFKNPIDGTDCDYLYVLKDYVKDLTKLYFDVVSMKQGIEDFIVKWSPVDVDVTPVFLDEKASDMEMYECRMDSTYEDEMEYEYWFLEQFIRKDEFSTANYETFYVECEEDTDGWIICKVYYKDPIDFGY